MKGENNMIIEKANSLIDEINKATDEEAIVNHILYNKILGYSVGLFSYVYSILKIEKYLTKYKMPFLKNICKQLWMHKCNLLDSQKTNWEINGEIIEENIIDNTKMNHLADVQCILIASMPNYLNSTIPVINRLVDEKKINPERVYVITNDYYYDQVKTKSNFNTISIEKLISIYSYNEYCSCKKRSLEKYSENGAFYNALLRLFKGKRCSFLRKKLLYVYREMVPETVAILKTLSIIISENDIKFVLGARKRRMIDNAIFEEAKISGIPTFLSVHGAIDDSENDIPVSGMFDVDYIFSWGKSMNDILETKRNYMKVGKILTFGSPILNSIYYRLKNLSDLEEKYDFLFLSQPKYCNYSGKIVSILEQNGVCVAIKPHPYDDEKTIKKSMGKEEKRCVLLDKDSDTLAEIVKSKICCTVNSTCFLDVMIAQKPLIIIGFKNDKVGIVKKAKDYNLAVAESWRQLLNYTLKFKQKEMREKIINNQNLFLNDQYGDYYNSIDYISDQIGKYI